MQYCVVVGTCFALANILADYGRSGSSPGVPDVSTVVVLVLKKLVVPVSLALESALDKTRPTVWQVGGVTVIMLGILTTSFLYKDHGSGGSSNSTTTHSSMCDMKILALLASAVPLAMGFYGVRVARHRLPCVSGVELWAILCVPEFFMSLVLSLLSQSAAVNDEKYSNSGAAHLWHGILCVAVGIQPTYVGNDNNIDDTQPKFQQAAMFFWLGLPFGFAIIWPFLF